MKTTLAFRNSLPGKRKSTKSLMAALAMSALIASNGNAQTNTSYSANACSIPSSYNAAFGIGVLTSATGSNNIGIGYYTLYSNTSGNDNTGNGIYALTYNTTGSRNTANGSQSLPYNTSGYDNTATGYKAGLANTTGIYNTSTGSGALYTSASGTNNTATGFNALYSTGNSVNNTATGSQALYTNSSGTCNTATGFAAMFFNTTGGYNTADGDAALYRNTSGAYNAGLGYSAIAANTTGNYNTGTGNSALLYSISGNSNTAVGNFALSSNTTANCNTALGNYALVTTNGITGGSNTACGNGATMSSETFTNSTAIGNGAIVNASDRVWLGNANVVNGNVWSYGTYNTVSDARYKNNINENDVKGIEFIKLLRPVVYNVDAKKFTELQCKNMRDEDKKRYLSTDFSATEKIRQSGFLAQEVEQAAKKSGYNFSGLTVPKTDNETYGLAYAQFVVPLVKAVQEQQTQIEDMNKTIASQQQQINELKAMVQAMAGLPASNGAGAASKNAANTAIAISDKNIIVLNQNSPNPFSESTVISYNIPNDFTKAQISISTIDGRLIQTVNISAKGQGSITVFASDLSAGTYTYTLTVDGKVIDTKKMMKD